MSVAFESSLFVSVYQVIKLISFPWSGVKALSKAYTKFRIPPFVAGYIITGYVVTYIYNMKLCTLYICL